MLTKEQLQELLTYEPNNGQVISLYLDSDTSKEHIDTIKLQVRGMIREAGFEEEKDISAIEQYLNLSFNWGTPGLALFSSAGGDFFRAYPSAVSFRNRVRVGIRPYVKPLAHLLDFYAHYGVILVDQVGARFYQYHLGELQAGDGFLGEDVHKLKQGRGSSAVGMRGGQGGGRHEEAVAHRNLREAATSAASFFKINPVRRLFLGGTNETVAEYRVLLSKQLQSCIAGTFAMDMNAGEREIRQQTVHLLHLANFEREQQLVDSLLATQARGGTAVIGLDETLEAVSNKRVQTLIISDGYRYPGYVDQTSSFVIANLTKSPLSEREMTAVDDVIDAACTITMNNSGHVEIVRDNPKLEDAGKIGALLRY